MKSQLIIILLTVFIIQTNGQEPDLINFDSIFIQLDEVGGCFARTESHYNFEIEEKKGHLKIIRNNVTVEKKIRKEEVNKFLPEFFAFNTTKFKNYYEIKDSCNTPTGDSGGMITIRIHNKDKKIEKEIKYESIVCSDREIIKFRNWIISASSEIIEIE